MFWNSLFCVKSLFLILALIVHPQGLLQFLCNLKRECIPELQQPVLHLLVELDLLLEEHLVGGLDVHHPLLVEGVHLVSVSREQGAGGALL